MAEETTKKKGQLAAAVLAGSALAFSSFAIGIPAALADDEPTPAIATATTEPETTPETPTEAPASSDDETKTDKLEDTEADDLREEAEPTAQVTEEEVSTQPSAEPSPDAPSLRQMQPLVDDEGGDDSADVNEEEVQEAALEDLLFEVSPRSGSSRTLIHVFGSGFIPEGEISIAVVSSDNPDAEPIVERTFTADVDGELNDVMRVTGPPGLYHVTATDEETKRSEVDTFNITDVTMDIDPESLSDEVFRDSGVTLTIEELEPNQSVDVVIANRYNPINELSGSATADEAGVATFDIQGAEDLADIYVGAYSVVVNESGSDIQLAEGSFEVTSETPRVSAFAQNPTDDGAVRQGEILYVTGYNASSEDTVTIDYGIEGVAPAEVETDEDGEFGTEFEIPADAETGDKTLTLIDDATGKEATTQYTVAEGKSDTESPQIELSADKAYPGEDITVEGEGFSSNADIEISINPTLAELEADADGSFVTDVTIPEDLEPGDYTLTVANQDNDGESASQSFEVLVPEAQDEGDEPSDDVVDPSLAIDPERIELDDFIGEPEDGAGVTHIVEGLEPGEVINYEIAGPEFVRDFESTAEADQNGVASFVIHGFEVSNPAVYLGGYSTVVTFTDEEDETVTLTGGFTVVDSDGTTGGTGDSDDAGPVDVNGSSGLAQTGATGVQLGFLAGGLLLLAGAGLVAFANRQRLFGRTA